MRLIDADTLKQEITKFHSGLKPRYISKLVDAEIADIQDIIDESPAVDAVPVVRCKDCKDYRNGICGKIEYIMDGYYHGTFEEKRPDDFCSYGEKKKRGKVHAAD